MILAVVGDTRNRTRGTGHRLAIICKGEVPLPSISSRGSARHRISPLGASSPRLSHRNAGWDGSVPREAASPALRRARERPRDPRTRATAELAALAASVRAPEPEPSPGMASGFRARTAAATLGLGPPGTGQPLPPKRRSQRGGTSSSQLLAARSKR